MGRSLRDLFITGKPLTLDDGQGEPIELFIRKMNDARHSEAMRRASAAKSRIKAALNDDLSTEYMSIAETVEEFGREGCIAYLTQDFKFGRERVVEAELAYQDEWNDDDYLSGLREAWIEGHNDLYAKDPEDVEAKRTFDEMKRFSDQVETEVEGQVEAFAKDLEGKTDEQLEKMVIEKYGEVRMATAWMEEFRKCEVWLSTFEPDRQTLALEDRSDVDVLEVETIRSIMDAIEALTVDGTEGKDSLDSTTS